MYEVLTVWDKNYSSITEIGAKFNSLDEMMKWLSVKLNDDFYRNYKAVGCTKNGERLELSRKYIEKYNNLSCEVSPSL